MTPSLKTSNQYTLVNYYSASKCPYLTDKVFVANDRTSAQTNYR